MGQTATGSESPPTVIQEGDLLRFGYIFSRLESSPGLTDPSPSDDPAERIVWVYMDSMYVTTPYGELVYDENGNPIIEVTSNRYNVERVSFIEDWTIGNGLFAKDISAIDFGSKSFDMNGVFRGWKSHITVVNGSGDGELVASNVVTTEFFKNWELSDQAWTPNQEEKAIYIIDNILYDIAMGEVEIVELTYSKGDVKESKMTLSEFSEQFQRADLIYVADPVTGELTEQEVSWGVTGDEIVGLRFIEDWYFDQSTFSFGKKVKYVGLVLKQYDEFGFLLGYYSPQGWVKYSD